MIISPMSVMTRVAERMTDYEPDYEFELNSKRVVLSAFNFALATISQLTPIAFTKPSRVTLYEGASHVIGECDRVAKIGNVYVDNEYSSTPDKLSQLNNKLRKPPSNCKTYRQRKYKMLYAELSGLNILEVYPPIPSQENVEMEILCACTPQANDYEDGIDVARSFVPIIEELMLYYLYDIDIESVPNRARASSHWQVATALLGVKTSESRSRTTQSEE